MSKTLVDMPKVTQMLDSGWYGLAPKPALKTKATRMKRKPKNRRIACN